MAEIVLTREEVREARDNFIEVMARNPRGFSCLFKHKSYCEWSQDEALCRLCKKLTEFASLQDPVGKGEEDE